MSQFRLERVNIRMQGRRRVPLVGVWLGVLHKLPRLKVIWALVWVEVVVVVEEALLVEEGDEEYFEIACI